MDRRRKEKICELTARIYILLPANRGLRLRSSTTGANDGFLVNSWSRLWLAKMSSQFSDSLLWLGIGEKRYQL